MLVYIEEIHAARKLSLYMPNTGIDCSEGFSELLAGTPIRRLSDVEKTELNTETDYITTLKSYNNWSLQFAKLQLVFDELDKRGESIQIRNVELFIKEVRDYPEKYSV